MPSLPRGSTSCAWRAKSADTRPLPQGRRPLIPASHHLRRAFPAPCSPAARGRHACPANALSPSRRPRFLFRRLSPPKSLPLSAPSSGRKTHTCPAGADTQNASLFPETTEERLPSAVASAMKSPSVYSCRSLVPSLSRGSTSCAWRAKSADSRPLPQGRRPLIPASHHLSGRHFSEKSH